MFASSSDYELPPKTQDNDDKDLALTGDDSRTCKPLTEAVFSGSRHNIPLNILKIFLIVVKIYRLLTLLSKLLKINRKSTKKIQPNLPIFDLFSLLPFMWYKISLFPVNFPPPDNTTLK